LRVEEPLIRCGDDFHNSTSLLRRLCNHAERNTHPCGRSPRHASGDKCDQWAGSKITPSPSTSGQHADLPVVSPERAGHTTCRRGRSGGPGNGGSLGTATGVCGIARLVPGTTRVSAPASGGSTSVAAALCESCGAQAGFPIGAEWLKTVQTEYGADAVQIDFGSSGNFVVDAPALE
jgi:hypothetical protein